MNIKASGRSALIIAAGFWLCVSGPLQAAEDADGGGAVYEAGTAAEPPMALNKFTKKSRPWKRASSQRKSIKLASTENTKPSRIKKVIEADAAMKDDTQSAIPPSVANANAQLAAADLPADTNSVSSKASNMLRSMAGRQGDSAEPETPAPAANMELVAADELNDLDRALSDAKSEEKTEQKPARAPDKPALAPTVAMAMAQAPAAVASSESTWDQTSLIGKIFIAFGGLLTLASAARMFMA